MIPILQIPSIVLPQFHPLNTEHEDILDLIEHTSTEFYIADIHEKRAAIVAIENVTVGAPGNLWWWVEISPVPSTVSTAYWAAILGGGGGVPPVAPNIIAATGVTGTATPDIIAWTVHSRWARVVVQCPVNAGILNPDYWQVQVSVEGKTP